MAKPNRAKMCNWLAGELGSIRLTPSNPADTAAIGQLRRSAEARLRDLSSIAAEMGWHADASLELAQEMIDAYKKDFGDRT